MLTRLLCDLTLSPVGCGSDTGRCTKLDSQAFNYTRDFGREKQSLRRGTYEISLRDSDRNELSLETVLMVLIVYNTLIFELNSVHSTKNFKDAP